MKNIHILSTDQLTGIFETNSGLQFSIMNKVRHGEFKGFHIYITSDEEIKEGDWGVDDENVLTKFCTHFAIHSQTYFNYRKVTLTTDPTLIADGVQAIDDDFLEWFVKNSSCEFVNLDSICKCVACDSSIKSSCDYAYKCKPQIFYKITIPQEEPKQEKEEEYFKHLEKDKKEFAEEWEEIRQEFGFGKQETLEEAAEKEFPLLNCAAPSAVEEENLQLLGHRRSFIKGANWQAERMYSEEEVRKAIQLARLCTLDNVTGEFMDLSGLTEVCTWGLEETHSEDSIIEQFKKK